MNVYAHMRSAPPLGAQCARAGVHTWSCDLRASIAGVSLQTSASTIGRASTTLSGGGGGVGGGGDGGHFVRAAGAVQCGRPHHRVQHDLRCAPFLRCRRMAGGATVTHTGQPRVRHVGSTAASSNCHGPASPSGQCSMSCLGLGSMRTPCACPGMPCSAARMRMRACAPAGGSHALLTSFLGLNPKP